MQPSTHQPDSSHQDTSQHDTPPDHRPIPDGAARALAAGSPVPRAGGRRSKSLPSADEIIAAARAAYEQARRPISRAEFLRMTPIKDWHICGRFGGGWTELRERAGLPRPPAHNRRYSDEELLAEYHRLGVELGRIPRWSDIVRLSRYSPRPYQARLGRKRNVMLRYRDWLKQHEPDSPLLKECLNLLANDRTRRDRLARSGPLAPASVIGEPINFRGLLHAPTNELGVIFLFGMLAEELGFTVLRIGAGFPDCEATRAVDPERTRWQRVLIEFEHRSQNFRDHGHDPAACDLVVCWRHDWPDCPVEVLELATAIRAA